jgi:hypothetical protein
MAQMAPMAQMPIQSDPTAPSPDGRLNGRCALAQRNQPAALRCRRRD